MKKGDRVVVIANNEWHGRAGVIADVTNRGDLVVELEVRAVTWKATFNPQDVELEARVKG